MRKILLLFIVILLNSLNLNAQDKFLDSLINRANNTNQDSIKISIYRQIYIYQQINNPQIAIFFAEKVFELAKENHNAKSQCLALNAIGIILTQTGKKDSGSIVLQKSLHIADSIQYLYGIAENLCYFSRIHFLSDNYDYAIGKAEQALEIFIQLDSTKNIPSCYNAIGNAYKDMGNAYKDMGMTENDSIKKHKCYDLSLENYFKAYENEMKLSKKSVFLANVANTYIQQKRYKLALKNSTKAVLLAEKSKNNYALSYTYLIKASSLNLLKKNKNAAKYFKKSRKYAAKIKNKFSILWATKGLMDVYRDLGLFEEAFIESNKYIELKDSLFVLDKQKIINNIEIKYLTKEKEQENKKLLLEKKHNQQVIFRGVIVIILMAFLLTIVFFLFVKKRKAEKRVLKLLSELKESKSKLSIIFEKSIEGIFVVLNSKVIFANPQTCKLLKCNLQNILGKNLIDFIYEEDKNMITTEFLSKLEKDNFIVEYQSRYVNFDNEVKWGNVNAARIFWDNQEASLIFFTDVTDRKEAENRIILQTKVLKKKNDQISIQNEELNQYAHELNTTNEELNTTLELVNEQKTKIEDSHKHIKDSINYASRIQNAILPSLDIFEQATDDYFVFFKPRDVVSGDFYWTKQIDEYFIYVTADCTGHGVPGAFVSMLGISLLNEIVSKNEITQPNFALNLLRDEIKKSLNQKGENIDENEDGMDLALCVINLKTKELNFSGANNPLYLIRNNELIEFKADRQPIGIYIKEKPFTNHEFQLQKGDNLYTFSDGFIDQFGGKNGKKFMKKRFKKLLLSMQEKTMSEQEQNLDNTFKNWKNNLQQLDDVLIVGVKV